MRHPTVPAPFVHVFALGGTIASLPGATGAGVSPTVRVEDLLAAVPGLGEIARMRATQFLQVPSCEVTVSDLLRLVVAMRSAVDAGAAGVVVTQGTDTLEETAFALDLLWDRPEPVVVTGAMRTPDAPGADGPANLLSAVTVAADPVARDLGVVAVLNDEVHAGRLVRKAHTTSTSAFVSPDGGPIGRLGEGRFTLAARPAHRRVCLDVASDVAVPKVAVLRIGMGESDDLLAALPGLGFVGAVVEGVGGGHVPQALVPSLASLVAQFPVVLASRTGAGPVLSSSYGYPGGDVDLVARGLVPAGIADAAKARLALVLALAAGSSRSEVETFVRSL